MNWKDEGPHLHEGLILEETDKQDKTVIPDR